MIAVLSDMNQPLGEAVGNALEVAEAIGGAQRRGTRRSARALSGDCRIYAQAGGARRALDGRGRSAASSLPAIWTTARRWRSSARWSRRRAATWRWSMIRAKLPQASIVETFDAPQSGLCRAGSPPTRSPGRRLNWARGARRKGDPIDLAVGLKVHVKVGDRVEQGAPLATIYANDADKIAACRARLKAAFVISPIAGRAAAAILRCPQLARRLT